MPRLECLLNSADVLLFDCAGVSLRPHAENPLPRCDIVNTESIFCGVGKINVILVMILQIGGEQADLPSGDAVGDDVTRGFGRRGPTVPAGRRGSVVEQLRVEGL